MKKTLLAGGLVALLALGLPAKSKALTFSDVLLCDTNNNCNFSVSGEYTDTFWRFTFNKIGGSGAQSEGVEMKVFDVPYGTTDPAEVTKLQNWNLAITDGSEPNTTTYDYTKKLLGQPIKENSPQTWGANFDGNQPLGIGNAPLTDTLNIVVRARDPPPPEEGWNFYASVPAPTIIPEPSPIALMGVGASMLGGIYYLQKKREEDN